MPHEKSFTALPFGAELQISVTSQVMHRTTPCLSKQRLHPCGEHPVDAGIAKRDAHFVAAVGILFLHGNIPRAAVAIRGGRDETFASNLLSAKLVLNETFGGQMQQT